jgi:hypothetical protein
MVSGASHYPRTAIHPDRHLLAHPPPGVQVSAERSTPAAAKHLFRSTNLIEVNGQPKIKDPSALFVVCTSRCKLLPEGRIPTLHPSHFTLFTQSKKFWLGTFADFEPVQYSSSRDAIQSSPKFRKLTPRQDATCLA